MPDPRMFTSTALLLAILLAPFPALAHKVVAAAWVEGNIIVGEVGMSDGSHVQPGLTVVIVGPNGSEIGRTETVAAGEFRYQPELRATHTFVVDMGMGHVARAVVPAADLPDHLPEGTDEPAVATIAPREPDHAHDPHEELEEAVAHALAAQMRPLRREIAGLRDELRMRDILGGIGYIIGLTGVGLWVAARRRKE